MVVNKKKLDCCVSVLCKKAFKAILKFFKLPFCVPSIFKHLYVDGQVIITITTVHKLLQLWYETNAQSLT